jgi:aspartate kinase
MIVMKFGGTSVGSAERIRGMAALVRERLGRQPLLVVSALSKVTDLLIRGAQLALKREPGAEQVLADLHTRHDGVIRELIPAGGVRDALLLHLETVLGELKTLYTGVHYLGELTPRSLDAISGVGERLSAEIAAAAMSELGLPAKAVDSRQVMLTDDSFGRAQPMMADTGHRLVGRVKPLIDGGMVPVLGSFIGSTSDGFTTTLGRGGSDWSAAIFGALLEAEEIQIWTDVDGMMTLDPRVVPTSKLIPEISFDEAAELAYFGAKVLHPATIKPAVERGIPVRILNSMNSKAPGTLITEHAGGTPGEPRAIAFKRGITVVLISEPKMLMASGFLARVFEAFARHRTPVDLIATSEVSVSLTIDDPTRLPAVRAELSQFGEVAEIEKMAIVSVVGRGFLHHPGLAARMFQALRDVNVVMISFGASDVNLSVVVAEADAEKAVRLLHREFFEVKA